MAIIVHGATRAHPSEEWVDLAIGLPDQNGNPFELVKLNWINKVNAPNARTHGFEDAIIQRGSQGAPKITYRKPGSVEWQKTTLNTYFGVVPRTQWNMTVLAHHYYEGLWEINDPSIRVEVKRMADEIEAALPEDLKTYNKKRRADMHRNRYESEASFRAPIAAPTSENKRAQAEHVQRAMDINKREREIRERERELERRERRLLGLEDSEVGFNLNDATKDTLMAMHMPELRKVCRHELKIALNNRESKEEVVARILATKRVAEENTGPEEVTG
jgi:hypothetical protein